MRALLVRRVRSWLLASILIACVGAEGYFVWMAAHFNLGAPVDITDRQGIEANAAIQLPESARDIHGLYSGFQEYDVAVRFTMNGAELGAFLKSTLCTEPLVMVNPNDLVEDTTLPDWWQVKRAPKLSSCKGRKEGIHQQIRST